MIIDKSDVPVDITGVFLNIFPDQFLPESDKEKAPFMKGTMDYMANVAFSQFNKHKQSFVKNYNLLNGIISKEDFYEDEEIKPFVDNLIASEPLPKYVQHYPIINPPINTMVGELTKRPDRSKVLAMDDDSRDEELNYMSDVVEQMIIQEGKKTLMADLAMKGQDISQLKEEDLDKMNMDKVKDYMDSFTSLGERWGNHVLNSCKIDFRMKEKSEDGFRDLLTASREFFHIYEDNSKLGFNIKELNPKNQWQISAPDVKYTSAVSGEARVPYATGTVEVLEISEIINTVPELTIKEIEHLRKNIQDNGIIGNKPSSFGATPGADSIQYDTYNRLLVQERALISSEMAGENGPYNDFLGLANPASIFGYKYTVVTAYWDSKKKVGHLVYMDETGVPQQTLVDESYIEGSPNEISIEWGWVNQMYMGRRIGPDIFHVKPYKLLPYSPIIGVIYGGKNATAKSLIDLMKPMQTLYNICLNQLYSLLGKEKGVVQTMSIRQVPTPKDGDSQDALDIWEQEAKDRGIVFIDDSPENTKGGSTSSNPLGRLDLSRTAEIQSRYNLAASLKLECWELVGMNRQRLGSSLASETASANQNSLVQSFAQTEPYFAAHEYVMNQVYQAILDAAQYIESNKPESTIKYITNDGEQAFIKVAGSDLRLKDLKIFVTSRAEDAQLMNEFRQLSQSMLQNGGSIYDVSVLYTTNSIRQMQKVFKDLKEKNEEMQAQQGQLEQSKLQQEAQQHQAELAQQEDHFTRSENMQKYVADLKANTDVTKAEIATYFKAPATDADGNGQPDILDMANHAQKIQENLTKMDLENKKMSFDMKKHMDDQSIKRENIKIQQQKIENEKKRTSIMAKKPKGK